MKIRSLFLMILFLLVILSAGAQKILNEQETTWVLEAKAELEQALSDPGLDEPARLSMIERSAKTLKEYGQPWSYPEGDIPLQEFMESNFEQCKERITEMSDMSLQIQSRTLDKQIEIINQLQIEVGERQLQMLIPGGNAAVSLSMELVNTVFDVNIVEGFSGGQRGNAQNLKERFIELAKQKKLGQCINQIIDDDKKSLIQLNKDRNNLKLQENKWESVYRRATQTTQTINGYEGAKLITEAPVQSQAQDNSPATQATTSFKANILVGTWKFGFKETGYFYLTFKNDGTFTFEDKMNGEDVETGKYIFVGNTLKLIGPKRVCEDVEGVYTVEIEPEEFRFKKIEDPCINRKFTLSHVWQK